MSPRARQLRLDHGWSQEELARRAGLSRPEVSAIETGRVVPSVRAALALGRALGTSVEALFADAPRGAAEWAWAPRSQPCRVWLADVGSRRLAFPCESGFTGVSAHDAVATGDGLPDAPDVPPTLVVAGCDPAVGLLDAALRERGVRVIAVTRSSEKALALLRSGVVHVAGLHLSGRGPAGNARAVRQQLGTGYRLVRWAVWDEGVAVAPDARLRSLDSRRLGRLKWVGRDEGSGARRCMEDLFRGQRVPRCDLVASDHREVAQAVRLGAAEAGICVRVVADEAGLGFLGIRTEAYDLCYRADHEADPAVAALLDALCTRAFRRLLGEVPGYETKTTGQTAAVG